MIRVVSTAIQGCRKDRADTQGAKRVAVVGCTGRPIVRLEHRQTLLLVGLLPSLLHLLPVCRAGEDRAEEAPDVIEAQEEDALQLPEDFSTQMVLVRPKKRQMISWTLPPFHLRNSNQLSPLLLHIFPPHLVTMIQSVRI